MRFRHLLHQRLLAAAAQGSYEFDGKVWRQREDRVPEKTEVALATDGGEWRVQPGPGAQGVYVEHVDWYGRRTRRARVLAAVPWEDLVALAALTEAVPDATFCVYCPPHEAQLLAGIAFAKGTPSRPEAMADCDAFLLVGDLFAVAPVAAGPVLARKQQRAAIVSLDVGDTITGRFAAHALQVAAGADTFSLYLSFPIPAPDGVGVYSKDTGNFAGGQPGTYSS